MPDVSSTTTQKNNQQILLDAGTNELEVLVFGLGKGSYGINVAKVREVIQPLPLSVCPNQPESVLGMFNLRGHVLPLVDLPGYLNIATLQGEDKSSRIIVTEFNGMQAGFQVERVEQIYRISWSQMRPPADAQIDSKNSAVTGIIEMDERMILMLDFESIVDHIRMLDKMHIKEVDNEQQVDRSSRRVFFAEDSSFIRNVIQSLLVNSGYTQVKGFNNGAEAWNAIQQAKSEGQLPDAIVTDIEMPQLDGLTLTKQIKADPELQKIPVIVFSSLITEDTKHKGDRVGANAQITKPQFPDVVKLLDRLIFKPQTATA